MKIDKSKPTHWLYLSLFGVVTLLAILFRPFVAKQSKVKRVVLYGHKLNSNLKGIYDYSRTINDASVAIQFLTMDPNYYRVLKSEGVDVLLATKLSTALALAKTDVIVSDHGLHLLIMLLKWSSIKFVDVWHGIPFKGFDADDFKVQQQYDEVWVTSKLLKQLYTNKFGFDSKLLHDIGYARTDVLINKNVDVNAIKQSIGITDPYKKVILFAPTWQQDKNNRSIFPFDTSEHFFLSSLDKLCEQLAVVCVFRAHLNTCALDRKEYKNILFAPHSQFPDTEAILLIGDVMVCDWSSIAFDFLLLDRPTIFLDVPPPFNKGFSLDESYRFGEVVKDFSSMLSALELSVTEVDQYWIKYGKKAEDTKRLLYGNTADGFSGERGYNRLNALVCVL